MHKRARSSALTLAALVVAGEAIFALPFVLPRVFRPTVLAELQIDNTALGEAMSVYGLVAMVAYGLGGPLADRFSARTMMTAALVTTAVLGGGWVLRPGAVGLTGLYGCWGVSTILLFWSGLMRATREWGEADTQGRAFGLLDGGRGLFAATLSSVALAAFAMASQQLAFDAVVATYAAVTLLAAAGVWMFVPEPTTSGPEFRWGDVGAMLRKPVLWVQGFIVVCAYVGYKGTDDLSLLARDVFALSEGDAAGVGTAAFWIRPIAAVVAGLLADRIGGWKTLVALFALLAAANLAVVGGVISVSAIAVVSAGAASCAAVYGLRGVYFAVFEDAGVAVRHTGTAVGVVSILGYTPDVFFGPLMGRILDSHPGAEGHRLLFGVLAAFALSGLVASALFGRLQKPTTSTS